MNHFSKADSDFLKVYEAYLDMVTHRKYVYSPDLLKQDLEKMRTAFTEFSFSAEAAIKAAQCEQASFSIKKTEMKGS